jgi:hypothetical protein
LPFKDCRDGSTVQIQYTGSSDFSTHNTSRMSGGRTPQQLRAERKQAQSHLDKLNTLELVSSVPISSTVKTCQRVRFTAEQFALPATKLRRHPYLCERAQP